MVLEQLAGSEKVEVKYALSFGRLRWPLSFRGFDTLSTLDSEALGELATGIGTLGRRTPRKKAQQ